MKHRGRILAFATALALALPAAAHAGPLPPGTSSDVYATGGDVIATFVGKSAVYTSYSYFFGSMYPADLSDPLGGAGVGADVGSYKFLFNNNSAAPGQSRNLGDFAAGSRLVFGIYVSDIDLWFYTGQGHWNPTGKIHAELIEPSPDGDDLRIGLEDTCKPYEPCESVGFWGDWDYNDHIIDLQNATATPEPVSMALLGTGLAGLAAVRRRRRNSEDEVE